MAGAGPRDGSDTAALVLKMKHVRDGLRLQLERAANMCRRGRCCLGSVCMPGQEPQAQWFWEADGCEHALVQAEPER